MADIELFALAGHPSSRESKGTTRRRSGSPVRYRRRVLTLWEQRQPDPHLAGSELRSAVQREPCNRGSSDGCPTFNDAGGPIDNEVLVPVVVTRPIQANNFPGHRIPMLDLSTFTHVTRTTSKCQIMLGIPPLEHHRDDVLDFKREIEGGFGSATVLATMPCASGNLRIERIHCGRYGKNAAVLFSAA